MSAITDNTPIAMLTVGQLKEVLRLTTATEPEVRTVIDHTKGDKVYGLKGIRDLFGVCNSTACEYKRTFLKPAVSQNGRVIVTDVALARKLFDEHNQ